MAAGFKIADAYVEIHGDDKTLREDVATLPKKVAPQSKKAGSDIGDSLSEGMRMSVIRNSPMIAAAVGGGLTLGAPLAMAGATTLFAGIAAVALSQNDRVKAAYAGLGTYIKNAAAEDASVLVPTFVNAAGRIGKAFDDLRPTLRETFVAIGPQIDTLTTGFIGLADKGIRGMATAAQSAGPVITGLASLLDSIGSGLQGFFTNLTVGADGGGKTLAALGDILKSLLPVVGQALGVFSQLAGNALPIVAGAVAAVSQALHDVLSFIEPIAPALGLVTGAVLTGVSAWKAYGLISGTMANVGASLSSAAAKAGAFTTQITGSANAGNAMATAGTKMANALPMATIGLAAAAAQAGVFQAGVDKAVTALMAGGQAQREYVAGADTLWERIQKNTLAFVSFGLSADVTQPLEATRGKVAELEAAMTPLELAQLRAKQAANEHADAVKRFGAESPQAKAAAEQLGLATDKAKLAAEQASAATKSYSDRLVELTGFMQGAIGAALSLEEAQNRTRDAAKALTDAQREHGKASNEARDANLQLRQAVDQEAQAAGRNAEAANKSKGETEAARLGAEAYRTKLMQLASDSDGRVRTAALANIDRLSDTELQALSAANQTSGLHTQMVQLPSGRVITITTPGMDAARTNVRGLQQEIMNINGKQVSIFVSATGKGGIASAARLAAGGPVHGPGTGTSDTAGLFALSNNEHVWTAAEVAAAGGHAGVEQMRKAVLARGRGMAAGGPVVALNTRYSYTGPSPSSIFQSLGQQYMSTATGPGGSVSAGGARGWIIQHESGGNPTARNPTSSASGLYQFIDGTWRSLGGSTAHAYQASVAEQNRIADRYVAQRYGSWEGAQRFWQAHHWYDQGGVASGPGFMAKGTLEPERVLSPGQTKAFERLVDWLDSGGTSRGGGQTVHIHMTQPPGSPTEAARYAALALRSV